jgi:ribosomal-protein-alanine N-acetyltransferase
MNKPHIFLETPRLILRTPKKSDAKNLQEFEDRNVDHLSKWRPELSLDPSIQIGKCLKGLEEKSSVSLFLFLRNSPHGDKECEIIGQCNFSQIIRGAFHACYLGYRLDAAHEGKGLMSEAARKGIQFMFEKQNLHRIMAGYMPSNARSAKLLQKLGFTIEGEAKNYLLINGRWEDHILTSLTNPKWVI